MAKYGKRARVKVKRNQQTPKDVKLNVLQNGYLGFPKLWIVDSKKAKCIFQKEMPPKIQNFIGNRKTGTYVMELCVTKSCTKFQANIFIFYL